MHGHMNVKLSVACYSVCVEWIPTFQRELRYEQLVVREAVLNSIIRKY
jgi:hypothetical protein